MRISKWGSCKLEAENDVKYVRIGDLNCWIQRKDEEIWIGSEYTSTGYSIADEGERPVPDDITWSRWAPRNTPESISILPVFPDLPLVIRSDYPLRVVPGASIDIFTRIPIWIQIKLDATQRILTELPTIKLSRTWFGGPMDGELCYWSTTKARRSLQNVEAKPYLVNCPIQVTNNTRDDLNFEKFCFRVERLKIFRYEDDLWADKSNISYEGEEQYSDITMSGKLPKGMEEGELLSAPRKPIHTSLATRTFHKIFDDSFLFGRSFNQM